MISVDTLKRNPRFTNDLKERVRDYT